MSGPTELLVLRLALIGLIFLFVAVVAVSLNGSLGQRAAPASAANSGRPRLVLIRSGETGLAQGTVFTLAGTMTVGRDPDAGILLADASVSTHHATIERVDGRWRVTDLASTNGTEIDGQPVGHAGLALRPRSRVTFGNVVLQLLVE